MKKVLILGPDYYNFIAAIEGAFKTQGWSVCSIPVHDFSLVRKIVMKPGIKAVNSTIRKRKITNYSAEVCRRFEEFKPAFVFILNANFIDSKTLDYLRTRATVAIWLFDNLAKMPDCTGNLHHCDNLFSFDKNDIKILEDNGLKAAFLPQACDTSIYYPVDCKKDIDILFVGNLYYYPNRQKTINKVIESFPDKKIKIIGEYKPWYKGVFKCLFRERRDIFTNHNIPAGKVNGYYNRAKIILNIHREDQKDGANPRLFEICGSGAYQISDSNPYIKSIFAHGEIGLFNTEDELIEAIQDALAHDKKREAQAAHDIVIKQHSFECRIRDVVNSIFKEA